MQLDEIQWINRHWTMADGAKPGLDMSWVTTETAGDPHWAWPVVLVALVCLPMIAALALIQITS